MEAVMWTRRWAKAMQTLTLGGYGDLRRQGSSPLSLEENTLLRVIQTSPEMVRILV